MGSVEVNKILINAARYLDAMHDIKIDEDHPRLDSIIRKHVLELETPQLIKYWKDYLADIDVENERTSIQESVVEIEKIHKGGIEKQGRIVVSRYIRRRLVAPERQIFNI